MFLATAAVLAAVVGAFDQSGLAAGNVASSGQQRRLVGYWCASSAASLKTPTRLKDVSATFTDVEASIKQAIAKSA